MNKTDLQNLNDEQSRHATPANTWNLPTLIVMTHANGSLSLTTLFVDEI